MPVPQPEEVMELAEELKEARSRVAKLESQWAAFFQQSPNGITAANAPPTQFLKPRIVALLESRPNMAFTTNSVAGELNAKENSVGPYLSDLVKEGKIERRGRGFYGALIAPKEENTAEQE